MSVKSARLSSNKGFTLVELLIVVAIIGVLASQGVPAYRRMIQKSKKGEVQVLLGNIGAAEAGFFSEYGVYGNNIQRMGAQMEANANLRYMGGFMSSGCGNAGTLFPAATAVEIASFTGYANVIDKTATVQGSMLIGALNTGTCPEAVTPTATTYTAAAVGNIHTSQVNPAVTGTSDRWTMNQNRQLNNTVDGVQ